MNYEADIKTFIISNFLYGADAQLQNHTSFLQGGILDSTGILELVTFLETTYNIQIETHELLPKNLDSIYNVARFLERKLISSQPAPADAAVQPCVYTPEPDEQEI